MCCGSRRAAWRSPASAPTAASGRAAATPSTGESSPAARYASPTTSGSFPSVVLDYLEGLAIRVRGPVTGQRYDFSPSQPSQKVDARDAVVLTRSGAFRHATS